jgi:hypothetical protein
MALVLDMDIWEEERGEGVDYDDELRAMNYSFLFTMDYGL